MLTDAGQNLRKVSGLSFLISRYLLDRSSHHFSDLWSPSQVEQPNLGCLEHPARKKRVRQHQSHSLLPQRFSPMYPVYMDPCGPPLSLSTAVLLCTHRRDWLLAISLSWFLIASQQRVQNLCHIDLIFLKRQQFYHSTMPWDVSVSLPYITGIITLGSVALTNKRTWAGSCHNRTIKNSQLLRETSFSFYPTLRMGYSSHSTQAGS